MVESYFIYIFSIIAIIIIYYLRVFFKKKKYYETKVDNLMDGKVQKKKYISSDYERIMKYFNVKKEKDGQFYLDEITWNDLNMDDIFEKANNAITNMGESVLYNMLRMPLLNQDSFKKRKEYLDLLSDDNSLRRKILSKLVKIEKTSESNILKIIYENKETSFPAIGTVGLLSGGLLLSIVMTFFNQNWLFPAIVLFIFNITMHYKNIRDMKIVCNSVNESVRLINSYKGLRKELKVIFGELPPIDEKVLALPKNPVSILQNINDMISEGLRMILLLDLWYYSSKIKTIMNHRQDIIEVYKMIGYVDALNSVIMYRNKLGVFVEPILDNKNKNLKVQGMYHPLLVAPISNSLDISKSMILTGSNASGKSTFLKTIAINVILSQTILTSHSKKHSGSFYRVITSIALTDNLKDGESYFIAEIKSLKRIFDNINKETSVLAIIDEILRGTNTVERISASSQVLFALSEANTITIAATHDHELCSILEKKYSNYHFEETIKDNKIDFDYIIKKGPSETKNAIKLLDIFKYDKKIVSNSEKQYADFMKTGKWNKIL